jgi:predicted site-specific integrase-resolvase
MNEKEIPSGYLPAREATKLLHVTSGALRLWAEQGNIKYIRKGGEGSHRYYDIKSFFESRGCGEKTNESQTEIIPPRRKICYCRVSSRGQKDDLERQEQYLKQRYPTHEFIKDIGSGLNFKRKGIKTILEYSYKGEIEELVVAHKDRLCRFGFEIFEFVISEFSKGRIIVLDNRSVSKNEELVSDILSIINVFSARVNGLRKYKTSIETEFRPTPPEQDIPKNDESKIVSNIETKEHS